MNMKASEWWIPYSTISKQPALFSCTIRNGQGTLGIFFVLKQNTIMLYFISVSCCVFMGSIILKGKGNLKFSTYDWSNTSYTCQCALWLQFLLNKVKYFTKCANIRFYLQIFFLCCAKVYLKNSTFMLINLSTFIFFLIIQLVYLHFSLFRKQNIKLY